MKSWKRFGIASVLILALSACAGAVPWNPQGYAGLTGVDIQFTEDGKLKSAKFISGREHKSVDVVGDMKTGKFEYHAKGTSAFDGQAVRSAVEQAVSADAKEAMPGIVDSVTKSILGVAVP